MAANYVIRGNQNTTLLMNQLKSSSKQYPPLDKDQERKLIEQNKGNRDNLNRLLFMHNIQLVFNIAKYYKAKTADYDGLVQDGMIGLMEATRRFDISRNIKFSTFCHIWIKKYILANFYGHQVDIDKRSMSLNAISQACSSKSGNGHEVTFENYVNEYIDKNKSYLKTYEDQQLEREQHGLCAELMTYLDNDASLSSTDKKIFRDLTYSDEKPKNIAEKYNVSMQYLKGLKTSIYAKFKDILHHKYEIDGYADIS